VGDVGISSTEDWDYDCISLARRKRICIWRMLFI
jgi:hypothetical protein